MIVSSCSFVSVVSDFRGGGSRRDRKGHEGGLLKGAFEGTVCYAGEIDAGAD